jgi:undecaprenyl-phosphate 4-deoxy-4-formamido-L-arabinose transferase
MIGLTHPSLRLSIVIPVYHAANTIERLVYALIDCLATTYELEILLVNDGSADGSEAVCRRLAEESEQVTLLNLSRNFGEHNAVMAGLTYCTGDCAVILDDDFQNPPEEAIKLVETLQQGYDVVYSYYAKTRHCWFRRLGSRFHNYVASLLLDTPRDLYLSSFKAISRFAIDQVIQYRGPHPYLDGLLLRVTRNYARVLVRHEARADGKSGYTLRKLVALWMSMFTSISVMPLRLASAAGFLCSLIGLVGAVVFSLEKLVRPDLPIGWASLIVSLFLIGGAQLFALGMIGEYLGRLFLQQIGQPQFVIRERVNRCPERYPSREAA